METEVKDANSHSDFFLEAMEEKTVMEVNISEIIKHVDDIKCTSKEDI